MQKLLFLLFMVFLPFIFFGQSESEFKIEHKVEYSFLENDIELNVNLLFTEAVSLSKNYPNSTSDVTSQYSAGFQGNLIRHYLLDNNFSIQAGISFGTSSTFLDLKLTEEFRSLRGNGYDDFLYHADFPYAGLNLGVNYLFYSKGKNGFSAGVSINANYFFESKSSYSISSTSTTGISKELFEARFKVEDVQQFIFSPQAELSYYRKLNQKFSLKTSIVGAYSNKVFLKSDYTIFGDNENLEGSFTKKYNHVGVAFGILYSFTK